MTPAPAPTSTPTPTMINALRYQAQRTARRNKRAAQVSAKAARRAG